jgi:phosphoglycolate phosphatase/pyrophosphatase PpaX
MEPLSFEEFVSCCFHPGFSELCRDILKFSEEEQEVQYRIWKSFTETKVPDFYPEFADLIKDYKQAGGIICVVSHSESEKINRDYMLNCGFTPDLVFGWEQDEDKRKPNPYPLLEIMKHFNIDNSEMLVVDDLKPGLDMARSCKVKFAAAGWSHVIPEIRDYMKYNSDYYFNSVFELREHIL